MVEVESLEGRALMASGGSITDIATLPSTLTVGPMVASQTALWFSELGQPGGPALGKLSANGIRSDLLLPADDAGGTITGVAADTTGDVWYAVSIPGQSPAGRVGEVTTNGTITELPLASAKETPGSVAIGPDGNLYVAVTGGPKGPSLEQISPTGATRDFPVTGASGMVTWLTKGPDGSLWFVDGQKIGKLTASGATVEFPMPAPQGGGAIDLSNAQLTVGSDGNVWFLGLGGISKITPSGAVTTIATTGAEVTALSSGGDGNLWVALVPPVNSDLGQTPGEIVMRLSTNGQTYALPDHVDTPDVTQIVPGNAAIWLNGGGRTLSWVNLVGVPTVSPQTITTLTTPVSRLPRIAAKVLNGAIVQFAANYPDAEATDFTASINYGDGYTGTGTVIPDANGNFDVVGYDVYKLPAGNRLLLSPSMSSVPRDRRM